MTASEVAVIHSYLFSTENHSSSGSAASLRHRIRQLRCRGSVAATESATLKTSISPLPPIVESPSVRILVSFSRILAPLAAV